MHILEERQKKTSSMMTRLAYQKLAAALPDTQLTGGQRCWVYSRFQRSAIKLFWKRVYLDRFQKPNFSTNCWYFCCFPVETPKYGESLFLVNVFWTWLSCWSYKSRSESLTMARLSVLRRKLNKIHEKISSNRDSEIENHDTSLKKVSLGFIKQSVCAFDYSIKM